MRYSFSELSNNTPKTLKMNKNSNPSFYSFFCAKPAFYRTKPRGERSEEIRGANAPLISTKLPRIRGFGCGSAARMWPNGHIQVRIRLACDFPPLVWLDLLFVSDSDLISGDSQAKTIWILI